MPTFIAETATDFRPRGLATTRGLDDRRLFAYRGAITERSPGSTRTTRNTAVRF